MATGDKDQSKAAWTEPLLAFCSNLLPEEDLDGLGRHLAAFGRAVRQGLGWDRLGVDLRLGSRAIAEAGDPRARERFRARLDAAGLVVTTINAFPLEAFQAPVVKAAAYRPDWSTARRQGETLALLPIVLALCPSSRVTISTVPGSYRPWYGPGNDPAVVAAAWGRWAAAAWRHHHNHGQTVVLCPEPEPRCLLETTAETAAFWSRFLATTGTAAASRALGSPERGRQAVADHLAVCYDTCHQAVGFEAPAAAIERLTAAGARPLKVQVSAAPAAETLPDRAAIAALAAMAEPRFLHQTNLETTTGLVRLDDLDGLVAAVEQHRPQRVRSHFHVPLHRPPVHPGLSSTAAEGLAAARAARRAGAWHLGVETYTWSVLADETGARDGTIAELAWLAAGLAD